MKRSVSTGFHGKLLQSAAVLTVASFAAGCSTDVARFSDNFYTNSVPSTPPAEITNPVYEPYPGDVRAEKEPTDPVYTGSVAREAAKPVDLSSRSVDRRPLVPASDNSRPALAPVASASRDSSTGIDPVTTGSIRPDAPVAVANEKPVDGWTRTGGTQVTLREGETIYNLSRRFGVPAKSIMRANGIKDASTVHAGRKIIIPTYVYSSKAPVSAPDSNPNTAAAKSSRGDKQDVPANKVPVPKQAPKREVAVLPNPPQSRESGAKKPANDVTARKTSPASKGGTHTVASGDTLWSISRRYGVTVDALRSENAVKNGNIRVGQRLVIPSGNATSVARKTDDTKTAAIPKKSDDKKLPSYSPPKRKTERVIAKADDEIRDAAPDQTGADSFRWPVRGRVISEFGERNGSKPNDGIDISVPAGTAVKAAENGIVIYAGDGLKEFGNTVLVRHENGMVTVYGHNSAIKVSRGERVRRGQQIALSGMSGTAESPRVHFELRKNSVPMNPLGYLK